LIKPKNIILILSVLSFTVGAQNLPEAEISFDFDDHTFNEKHQKIQARPVGIVLTTDRFGNTESAAYIQGNNSSYLNLGTSVLLKPEKGTIALWVKIDRDVRTGKGYQNNPIIITKNSPRDKWFDAYVLAYDLYNRKFGAGISLDSILPEVIVYSKDTVEFNKWYHLVFSFDNDSAGLYVNGILQTPKKLYKGFKNVYYEKDSVVIGHTANKFNQRYLQGTVDDIKIFHRVLSDKELKELYQAPNPNKFRDTLNEILKYSVIIAIVIIISGIIWYRHKLREKQKLAMQVKISELEMKVMKAQMNPHFIFNSLNSLQEFIMTEQNEKAQNYLTKFSKLLRDILESNLNESLSVEEEVEILNHYMEMEAARFNKLFEYTIHVDERINRKETRIPHLLVQPFVENAIWHGLLPKKNDRKLYISFEYRDEKTLKCIINDNGIGRMESSKKENTFKKRSLALSFVKQRLELMGKTFQVDCYVQIEDKFNEGKPEGTKVIIILPIVN
jgi:hypothetical protein